MESKDEAGEPVCVIVIGGGSRGSGYAEFALDFPERMKVVGIADPIKEKRDYFQKTYNIDPSNVWCDWQEAVQKTKDLNGNGNIGLLSPGGLGRKAKNGKFLLADAVIVATPDQQHRDQAVAFAKLGYDMLVEKPMAVTKQDCQDIVQAVNENKVIFGCCHVLRYTPVNRKLSTMLRQGAIGQITMVQHTEPVGFWHFAHSFVRGNWRRKDESTFSLMAKCCHDVDLVKSFMHDIAIGNRALYPDSAFFSKANKCVRVSSFGSVAHFSKNNKPPQAGKADRCVDCAIQNSCPYSATQIYINGDNGIKASNTGWPVKVLVNDVPDIENITEAVKKGPYGRCVYECDNDVNDNQAVVMQFSHNVICQLSMIATTEKFCERQTKFYGSLGEITVVDGEEIFLFDFQKKTREKIPVPQDPRMKKSRLQGHGGADFHIMDTWVDAVQLQDHSLVLTNQEDSLDGHLLTFAAQDSCDQEVVVKL